MRTPLGKVLFCQIDPWKMVKIKKRLVGLGLTEGGWRTIYERTPAYKLPTFVRDVIIKEIPEAEPLFDHPKLHEPVPRFPLDIS